MLKAPRSRVLFIIRTLDIFSLHKFSRRSMALGMTQPLIEMSTRNLPEVKVMLARKADKHHGRL
jgi:hypothetical protein